MEASNSTIRYSGILDKETFTKLVQENKVSLYRIAKSILKNETYVEDAIGETLLKAYEHLNKLKSAESFKSWIMKILVNECYYQAKRYKRVQLKDDLSEYEGISEDYKQDSLMIYVNKLEEKFKTVVILFYYEDLSMKSISSILGISEGTVKSRLFRAKAKLKDMMKIDYGR